MLTARQRMQALPALLTLLSLCLALAAPARAAGAADRAVPRNPVVFVHGYNADPGVWGALRADLRATGYTDAELFSFGYDTHLSVNEVLAGRLGAYVDQVRRETGAARVDVVAHSFGSLVSRWYVKFGGGAAAVDHWVSLAGPNRGTSTAWACALWDQACRDMTPGSYVVKKLNMRRRDPGRREVRDLLVRLRRGRQPGRQRPAGRSRQYAGGLPGAQRPARRRRNLGRSPRLPRLLAGVRHPRGV